MNDFFLMIGIGLLLLIFLVIIRLVKGPSIIDRVMAVNVLGTKTVILLVIIGQVYGRLDMFIDLALAYALLNFISSLVAAKFIKRRKDSNMWRDLNNKEQRNA